MWEQKIVSLLSGVWTRGLMSGRGPATFEREEDL